VILFSLSLFHEQTCVRVVLTKVSAAGVGGTGLDSVCVCGGGGGGGTKAINYSLCGAGAWARWSAFTGRVVCTCCGGGAPSRRQQSVVSVSKERRGKPRQNRGVLGHSSTGRFQICLAFLLRIKINPQKKPHVSSGFTTSGERDPYRCKRPRLRISPNELSS
jgi:hypothetical protein